MAEPLLLTDLVLAFVPAITGSVLGRRAGRRQAQRPPTFSAPNRPRSTERSESRCVWYQ